MGHCSSHSVLWWFQASGLILGVVKPLSSVENISSYDLYIPYLEPGCQSSRMIILMQLQSIWLNGIIFVSSQGLWELQKHSLCSELTDTC